MSSSYEYFIADKVGAYGFIWVQIFNNILKFTFFDSYTTKFELVFSSKGGKRTCSSLTDEIDAK